MPVKGFYKKNGKTRPITTRRSAGGHSGSQNRARKKMLGSKRNGLEFVQSYASADRLSLPYHVSDVIVDMKTNKIVAWTQGHTFDEATIKETAAATKYVLLFPEESESDFNPIIYASSDKAAKKLARIKYNGDMQLVAVTSNYRNVR